MATGRPTEQREPRSLRLWLWLLILLVTLMVTIGGATRLTGSGLSITEWKPVTGAIPPLSDQAWDAEFEKYRASSQYQNLNRGMELPEFKTIYWWEWSHRQLGRFLGLVFFVPFLWFFARGTLRGGRALALLAIAGLGGLQATVGWIMVASGLEPGMVAVAPLKLSIHLTLASLILAGLVWMAVPGRAGAGNFPSYLWKREGAEGQSRPSGLAGAAGGTGGAGAAFAFVWLVVLQIALGGLVAGSQAGLIYTDWPLMNGDLVPPAETLFAKTPLIENFIDNHALVQLNHRLVAYLLLAFAIWHALSLGRRAPGSPAAGRARWLAILVTGQAMLGIATLVLQVPLWAGLAHQFVAMGILAHAVAHAKRSLAERPSGVEAAPVAAGQAARA